MTNIVRIMQEKGISRYKLSKESGLNYHTLINIERGGDVLLSTLKKIAVVLGVSVRDLIAEESEEEK